MQAVAAAHSDGRAATGAHATATVTAAAFQGESPTLSTVTARPTAVRHGGVRPAGTLPSSPPAAGRPTADPSVQTAAGGAAGLMTAGTSFEGVGHDDIGVGEPCGTPPDPNSDVSDSYVVEIVNCGYDVFDKSGTPLLAHPLTTDQIFTGMSGPCDQVDDGDGVVRYDRLAHRWLVSQFALANADGLTDPQTGQVYTQNFQCVAISKSADPTGDYWLYAFGYTGFNDYPKFGVWPDAYYVTYNMFTNDEASFTGVKTCALDRASMLTGKPATQQCFDDAATAAVLPANDDGATAAPAGAPNYQVALRNSDGSNLLDAWTFHVDWATPANTSFTQLPPITVDPYVGACASSYTCIPQAPGPFFTTPTLDSLGDRLMYPLQYRNFGDHQSLVVSHSIKVNNAGAAERWYELRVGASNSLSLFQQGTYAPGDGLYRFMGSIAQDGAGDMALGYSDSGPSDHPGIRLTGRLAGDTAGTMSESEHVILTGTGSEAYDSAVTDPPVTRWGDYTSMDVDPSDDCTFWYTNQFYDAQTDGTDTHFYRRWHTQIASYTFPQCSDFGAAVTPTSRTGNTAASATISTTLKRGSTQTVDFQVSGCPTGATCTAPSAAVGSNASLSLVPGAAADGTYHLTIRATGSVAGVHTVPFTWTLDRSKPAAVVTAPTAPFALSTSATVAWRSTSSGGSAIGHFDIQRRVAPYNAGFGAWSAYATKPAGTLSMTATGLAKGSTYCFRVRAVDLASNTGDWSAARCTAVPLDDRALAATTGWARATGSSYWNGTSTNTSTRAKVLTRTGAQLDRLAVVATRCSTCGIVGVYVGTQLIAKIDTSGATQYRRLYVLSPFSYRTGTVTIKVLTSGKPVRIDGLGITRA